MDCLAYETRISRRRISDSQLAAARLADAVRGPFRLPDQIDFNFADVGNAGEAIVDLLKDEAAGGALRSSQRHGHLDPLAWPSRSGVRIRAGRDCVDQAQVH